VATSVVEGGAGGAENGVASKKKKGSAGGVIIAMWRQYGMARQFVMKEEA